MATAPASKSLASSDISVVYFDLPAIGRGEVVRFFLEDNGLKFKDERFQKSDWPQKKAQLVKDGTNPAGHVPVTTIDGRTYTEHIATCRYIARRLGLYGKDPERDFFADAVADAYHEWRNAWAKAMFMGSEEEKQTHWAEVAPEMAQRFEVFLSRYPEGPFFTGEQFTFADAAVFQIIHDEEKLGKPVREGRPLLSAFYEAVAARPNIAAYIKSERRRE